MLEYQIINSLSHKSMRSRSLVSEGPIDSLGAKLHGGSGPVSWHTYSVVWLISPLLSSRRATSSAGRDREEEE